jgi:high-affinity Fe2+/Pb2+ permease
MSRESKILLWCLVGGACLVSLAAGESLFEALVGYPDSSRHTAQAIIGAVGVMLLVACFVLREVFRTRK